MGTGTGVNMSSVMMSESLTIVLDHVSSIKLYQSEETKMYFAEVYTLTGSFFSVEEVSLEGLFYEVMVRLDEKLRRKHENI